MFIEPLEGWRSRSWAAAAWLRGTPPLVFKVNPSNLWSPNHKTAAGEIAVPHSADTRARTLATAETPTGESLSLLLENGFHSPDFAQGSSTFRKKRIEQRTGSQWGQGKSRAMWCPRATVNQVRSGLCSARWVFTDWLGKSKAENWMLTLANCSSRVTRIRAFWWWCRRRWRRERKWRKQEVQTTPVKFFYPEGQGNGSKAGGR